ncbi:hypothetical protein ACA910_002905 [Epithemia clementina (nom. ined.)]
MSEVPPQAQQADESTSAPGNTSSTITSSNDDSLHDENNNNNNNNDDDDDDNYNIKKEAVDHAPTRPQSSAEFAQTFRFSLLIDPREPWILVDNGSFLGYFDWVPSKFRVGPWSPAAICYLTIIFYLTALSVVYLASEQSRPWWSRTNDFVQDLNYPPAFSPQWWYNVILSLWMMYINYLVLAGPLSIRAWSTYTIQSWTSLWIRHILCALAPFSSWALTWAEYLRFPVACSATCTFVIWNGLIFPYAYFIGLKTEEQKKGFYEFAFSFRLVQIHFFNLLFCVLNIVWTSPIRPLEWVDLNLAFVSAAAYMAWYLLVLDRLGVHFYPIFTPRVGWMVVTLWTMLVFAYFGTFFLWKSILSTTTPIDAEVNVVADDISASL